MKILVTGGVGFIGSHVVDLLVENNYDICVIDNLSHGKIEYINPKAKFYKCDILNQDILNILQIEKPEIIIHLAAQVNASESVINPLKDAKVNIIGTINLLEAAKKAGVKKILYSSSAAVFGEPEYLPIDEKHPLDMISGYGVSKHTVEHYLSVYKKLYNISYIVLRYANVYGPRQDASAEGGVVSIFCDKILNDEVPYIYGTGEQTRDFVYVKDVAKANLLSIRSDKEGIFNVCTNKKTSINELFKMIMNMLNKNVKPLYTTKRDGDIDNSYMSYEKIFNNIGWKPDYEIIEGMRETIQFYKNNINY